MSTLTFLVLVLLAGLAVYAFLRTSKRRAGDAPEEPADAAPRRDPEPPQSFETFATRLKGDMSVGGTSSFPGNVLLQGNLVIEDEGIFNGAAEVFGNVTLGARAQVNEPLIVHGNLTLKEGARVRATRVEGDVTLERDAIVDGPLDCERVHLVEDAPPRKREAKTEAQPAQT